MAKMLLVCGAMLIFAGVESQNWEEDWVGDLVWASNASAANIDIISLGFQQAEHDFSERLHGLIDQLMGFNSSETGPWTFVTFVTLMPLECDQVKRVIELFDSAMQASDPGWQPSSVARRLGSVSCSGNNVCPCVDQKYVTRILELRSRSWSKSPTVPKLFPYNIRMTRR